MIRKAIYAFLIFAFFIASVASEAAINPDFQVFDARAGYKILNGRQALKFTVRIRNNSDRRFANIPVRLEVYDPQGFKKEFHDRITSLPPRRAILYSKIIPNPRSKGVYTLVFTVNPNRTIAESNFANNRVTVKTLDVSKLPDLTISHASIEYSKKSNALWWSIRITNRGPSPAKYVPIALDILSPDGTRARLYRFVPKVDPGKSVGIHEFDLIFQKGPYRYTFTVNPFKTVAESNTNNNSRSVRINVK